MESSTTTAATTTTVTTKDELTPSPAPDVSRKQQEDQPQTPHHQDSSGGLLQIPACTVTNPESNAKGPGDLLNEGTLQLPKDDRCVMCDKWCRPNYTLPCHRICTPCLELLVTYRDRVDVIQCPQCYRLYPMTAQWRDHLSRNKLRMPNDDVYDVSVRRCYFCKPCKQAEWVHADHFCCQCQQPLCSPCHKRLHSATSKRRRHHIVTPLVPIDWSLLTQEHMTYCSMHGGQPLSIFCLTCEVSVCDECREDTHTDHEIWNFGINLQNAINTLQGRLRMMMEHKVVIGRLLNCLTSLSETLYPPASAAWSHHLGAAQLKDPWSSRCADGKTPKRHQRQHKRNKTRKSPHTIPSTKLTPSWDPENSKPQGKSKKRRRKRKGNPARAEDPTIHQHQCNHENNTEDVSEHALRDSSSAGADTAAKHPLSQKDCDSFTAMLKFYETDCTPDTFSFLSDMICYESRPSDIAHSEEEMSSHRGRAQPELEHLLRESHEDVLVSAGTPLRTAMAAREVAPMESLTRVGSLVPSEVASFAELEPSDARLSDTATSDNDAFRADVATSVIASLSTSAPQLDTESSEKSSENALPDKLPLSLDVPSDTVTSKSVSASSEKTSSNSALSETLPVPSGSVSPETKPPKSASKSMISSNSVTSNTVSSKTSLLQSINPDPLSPEGGLLGCAPSAAVSSAIASPDCAPADHVLQDIVPLNSSPFNTSSATKDSSHCTTVDSVQSDTESFDVSNCSVPSLVTPDTTFCDHHSLSLSPPMVTRHAQGVEEHADNTDIICVADVYNSVAGSSQTCISSIEHSNPDPSKTPDHANVVGNTEASECLISRESTTASSSENTGVPHKGAADCCRTLNSPDIVVDSMISAQEDGSQDKGTTDQLPDQQTKTCSSRLENSMESPWDMQDCACNANSSVVTNDTEKHDSFLTDDKAEEIGGESKDRCSRKNSKLEEIVKNVFGHSLCQHQWTVQTVYHILQTRIDNLKYDLSSSGLGYPCSVVTWMNARPAVSNKVYLTLKKMFPNDTPGSASTTYNTRFSNNSARTKFSPYDEDINSDDIPSDWTKFESGYCSQKHSRPDDLIILANAEHGTGHSDRNYDQNIYSLSLEHCKPGNLTPLTETDLSEDCDYDIWLSE